MHTDRPGDSWVVRFDRSDLHHAFDIAWLRNEPKRQRSITSRKLNPKRDDLTTHVFGVLAEMAVMHVLDSTMDTTSILSGDKHKPDHILYGRYSLQTKYRDQRGWSFALYSTNPDEFNADIGILVYPARDRDKHDPFDLSMEIVGCISRDKFFRVATIANYGYGDRYIVESNHFTSINSLINLRDVHKVGQR